MSFQTVRNVSMLVLLCCISQLWMLPGYLTLDPCREKMNRPICNHCIYSANMDHAMKLKFSTYVHVPSANKMF